MNKNAQRRVAEEAARLMADGVVSEYLEAKERAVLILGLSSQTRLPSNRKIKEYIGRITQDQLGATEVERRLKEMREIAYQIMCVIEEHDPMLIGSTLSGQIRESSDIDLHAYCDDFVELQERLTYAGYDDVEEEVVENRKGRFVHLRWTESRYPVEVTVYPWSWREVVPISSVTGKPMKRADLKAVKHLVAKK